MLSAEGSALSNPLIPLHFIGTCNTYCYEKSVLTYKIMLSTMVLYKSICFTYILLSRAQG